jgi:hypothetical protein
MKTLIALTLITVSAFAQAPPPAIKPTTPAQMPAFLDATASFIGYVIAQNNGKAQQVSALQSQVATLSTEKANLQAQVVNLQSQLTTASAIPADWLPHIQALVNLMNSATVASNAGTGPTFVATAVPGSRLQFSLHAIPPPPADPAAPLADGWVFLESWTAPTQIAGITHKSETWIAPQQFSKGAQ